MRPVVIIAVVLCLFSTCFCIAPYAEVREPRNLTAGPDLTRLPLLNWTTMPQTSVSNPTIHKYIEITVPDEIPGAKVYRLDRVTDMTGATLHTDPAFPRWLRNNPSIVKFEDAWGRTSVADGIYYLRLSAWNETQADGGVQISQNSSVVDIHYDHSHDYLGWDMSYEVRGPGDVTIKVSPQDTMLAQQTRIYAWFEYRPKTSGGYPQMNANGHPVFEYIGQQSKTTAPEFHISLPEPGVRYFGLYGAYNGDYANTPRATLDTGCGSKASPYRNGSFQPIAIVVPYDNGTIPARVANYTGVNVTTPVLPGDHRFAFLKDEIGLVSGMRLHAKLGGSKPRICEVDVPQDWSILNYDVANTGYLVENVTSEVGSSGGLPPGFIRLRLNKTAYSGTGWWWSYGEDSIPIIFNFPKDKWNGMSTTLRFRVYDGLVNFSRTDNWQDVKVNCRAIPDDIQLPTRLSTGVTWSSPSWLKDPGLDNETAFFTMYKQLGFNTVPQTGLHYSKVPDDLVDLYTKENRTGAIWDGMMWGPEHSSFYRGLNDAYGLFYMLGDSGKDYIDTMNLATYGVPPSDYSHEREKWLRAIDFHENGTAGNLDMAYRGVWFNRSVQHLTYLLYYIQPEYIFLDCEGWDWFYTWEGVVSLSDNAEARRLPGETDYDLAYRMCDEFWTFLMENLTWASPSTKVALYDCTAHYNSGYQAFKWEMLEKHNVVCQPSVYSIMKHTRHYANYIRLNREQLPKGYELVPWLSSGTYGEHDASLLIDTAAHTFMNGATGISFYSITDVDDHDDILNIATVIGCVSPYEDIIMDGDLAYGNVTASTNAVISAMGLDGKYLLAVTPENASNPVTFTFEVENVTHHYSLYDLRHDKYYNFTPSSSISFDDVLSDCGVFILRPYVPPPPPQFPPFFSSPFPADGAVNVSLNTTLGISVFDNNTDLLNLTWYSNASGAWEEIGATDTVNNGTYYFSPGLFISYNTTYHWAVNVTDGLFFVNETFGFTTVQSDAPVYKNPVPAQGAVNVSVNLTAVTIDLEDPEGDLLDWSITTTPDIGTSGALGDSNGTKTCTVAGLEYNTTYTWKISFIDPLGSAQSQSPEFTFTTEREPLNITPPPPPPPNKPPISVINGPYFGYAGEPVEFSSAGSLDPDGHLVSFLWEFGDDTNSTDADPKHTYGSVGNYTVKLTVTDNRTATIVNSTYARIVRRNGPPSVPEVEGNTSLLVMNFTHFRFRASDPDGDLIVYHIDWGDNLTTVSNPQEGGLWFTAGHAWAKTGNYTIIIFAEDDFDQSASGTAEFKLQVREPHVEPPPPVDDDDVDDDDDDGPGLWVYGLIIALAVIVLAVIVVIVIFFLARKKKAEEKPEEKAAVEGPGEEDDGKSVLPDPSSRDQAMRSRARVEEQPGGYWEMAEEPAVEPEEEPNIFDESVTMDDDFLEDEEDWELGSLEGMPDPQERDGPAEPAGGGEDAENKLKDLFEDSLEDLDLDGLEDDA